MLGRDERLDDARGRGTRRPARGVDGDRRDLLVQPSAFGEDAPPRVDATVREDRARHVAADAVAGVAFVDGQVDDGVLAQRRPRRVVEHRPATEREDSVERAELLGDDVALDLAERGLAVRREVVTDRAAEAFDDERVAVAQFDAPARREGAPDGRLAGRHRPDEHGAGTRVVALGVSRRRRWRAHSHVVSRSGMLAR